MNLKCILFGHIEKKKYRMVSTKRFSDSGYTRSRAHPFKVILVTVYCERCEKFLRNE